MGSQILEAIIRNSSSETIDFIFAQYFEENVAELCFDEAGHFAVERILERVTRPKDIDSAVDKILYQFHDLICETSSETKTNAH